MEPNRISTRSQGLSPAPIECQDDPESILRGKSVTNSNVHPAQQNDFSSVPPLPVQDSATSVFSSHPKGARSVSNQQIS